VIVVGCGFPDQAFQERGGYGNSVQIDVTIALDHLSLAAVAEAGTAQVPCFRAAEACLAPFPARRDSGL